MSRYLIHLGQNWFIAHRDAVCLNGLYLGLSDMHDSPESLDEAWRTGPWVIVRPDRYAAMNANGDRPYVFTDLAQAKANGKVLMRLELEDADASKVEPLDARSALLDACQAVVDNWKSGDLAAAVRQCAKALKLARGEACSSASNN